MRPLPTRLAVYLYGAASVLVLAGLAAASLASVVLGSALLIALTVVLTLTMPLGRRVRRMQLEFAWWTAAQNATGTLIPGAPFRVRCLIRHRAPFDMTMTHLSLIAAEGARVVADGSERVVLPAGARSEFEFEVVVASAGRWVIHGLAVRVPGPFGLFEVPLYFPNPLTLKVLPRVAGRRVLGAPESIGVPVERHGRASRLVRGSGMDLHELRELVPGDAFRTIAWKASARRGKWLVREVEQETQETLWLVVDSGPSMRGGVLGARALDRAIEFAASESRVALERGARVGLVALDGRPVRQVPARDDKAQLLRIYDALLGLTEIVDEDLTAIDDARLHSLVGDYLQRQDGIDFRSTDALTTWDVGRMVEHVRRDLDATRATPVRASDSVSAAFRRFCLLRGVPLPYRDGAPHGERTGALLRALQQIATQERAGARIVVLSDLDGGIHEPDVRTTLALLRAHGHRVTFELPPIPSLTESPEGAEADAAWIAVARAEAHRLEGLRVLLRRAGAHRVVLGRPMPTLAPGRFTTRSPLGSAATSDAA